MVNHGNCKNVRAHISEAVCTEMRERSARVCGGCDGPLPVAAVEAPMMPSPRIVVSFEGYEAELEKLRVLSEADGHTLQEDMLTILLLFIRGQLLVLGGK